MTTKKKLVIGTRGSALALAQSHHMRDRILALPDGGIEEVELLIIKTRGDKILDVALSKVGGKGLFVKELEEALLDGRVDLAVHSMKDMPSALPPGLVIGAVPEREDPRDAWVRPRGSAAVTVDDLPPGAVVGTSSLRRQAQLLVRRPDLTIVPIRGNVDTRLAKLDAGVDDMAAIVLACAGLRRLGLEARVTRPIPPVEMVPAVGQGALAIECRGDDARVLRVLGLLDHADTRDTTTAERAFLLTLEGGCQVPIAGHATLDGDDVVLEGLVATIDGQTILRQTRRGPRTEAAALGHGLAQELIGQGAGEIIATLEAAGAAEAVGARSDA